MKKIAFLIVLLASAASSSYAAHKNDAGDPAGNPDSYWLVGVGPSLSVPLQNINTIYSSGVGGDLFLGCALNRDVVLQLDLDNISYSSNGLSDYELRLLPSVRYLMGGEGFRPYLLGGLGLDFQFASALGQSATGTSLEEYFGLGGRLTLSDRTFLFLEGKFSFIFSSGVTGSDLPISAGLEFGL